MKDCIYYIQNGEVEYTQCIRAYFYLVPPLLPKTTLYAYMPSYQFDDPWVLIDNKGIITEHNMSSKIPNEIKAVHLLTYGN